MCIKRGQLSFGNQFDFITFPNEIMVIPKLVYFLFSCAFTHVPYITLHNTTESLHITAIVCLCKCVSYTECDFIVHIVFVDNLLGRSTFVGLFILFRKN